VTHFRVLERGRSKVMLTAVDVWAIATPLGVGKRGPNLL